MNYYTAVYRAKYKLDSDFYLRERERLLEKKRRHRRQYRDRHDGSLTADVLDRLYAEARECPYCEREMGEGDKTLDHKTPLSLGGLHTRENVAVCCLSCNSAKCDMSYETWLERLAGRAA